jgi:hypothetical protein
MGSTPPSASNNPCGEKSTFTCGTDRFLGVSPRISTMMNCVATFDGEAESVAVTVMLCAMPPYSTGLVPLRTPSAERVNPVRDDGILHL